MDATKSAGTPLMELENVSKGFANRIGEVQAVHGVSCHIGEEEFVALLGPSGSGKSTLLRIAGGLLQPDEGKVWFDGEVLREPSPDIGFVFQSTNLMPWRTVLDNVLLPVEVQIGSVDDHMYTTALDLLRIAGLAGFEEAYPKHLSGGMAQRVVLARALIQNPALLLMDEPFGALDALTRERMNTELLRIHEMRAMAVFMVTHSIAEAVFLADRIIVFSERPGRVVAQVEVDLPRPRTVEMLGSSHFASLTSHLRTIVGAGAAIPAAIH